LLIKMGACYLVPILVLAQVKTAAQVLTPTQCWLQIKMAMH